jgi:xanthine/uracil permease
MKKKGSALQVIGIVLLVLQLMSYTRLDLNELFTPNSDIVGDIMFLIGYSLMGIIGVGLLILYKKKNFDNNEKNDKKESNKSS